MITFSFDEVSQARSKLKYALAGRFLEKDFLVDFIQKEFKLGGI